MVQEKYQEVKACDKRHPYHIIIIIVVVVVDLITILSILSSKIKGRDLEICVLYDTCNYYYYFCCCCCCCCCPSARCTTAANSVCNAVDLFSK